MNNSFFTALDNVFLQHKKIQLTKKMFKKTIKSEFSDLFKKKKNLKLINNEHFIID